MYKEHPVFEPPPDKNAKIWRYLTFAKLVSMLETRSLFFARADRLGDSFEGSLPRANERLRAIALSDTQEERAKEAMKMFSDMRKFMPRYHAINCWHINDHESAAMWGLYLRGDEGVAIQSTFSDLTKSFVDEDLNVYVGVVKYLDYDDDETVIPEDNAMYPLLCKRKSFEHERELRAIVAKYAGHGRFGRQDTIEDGLLVAVDLNTLINEIRVAPDASSWFAETVSAVVKRFGLARPVLHSRLDELPRW